MNRFFLALGLTLLAFNTCFSQTNGIYESYAILDLNGGGNTYYDLLATTGNPDFQGSALGSFNSSNSLVVVGGQNKTYKCDGGDIFNGHFYYRVWLTTAGASGVFTSQTMSFVSNDGGGCGGNQTWEFASGATNIISSLTVPGNYTLEVYSDADGVPGTTFASNGGANYKATFNYCGPSSGALPAGNYAIPGCFPTIASAVAYINVNGVSGTGTVQFDVAAGYTETAPLGGISITATGTATLAIKFVKSGVGTNPTITAFLNPTAGLRNDAVFKIIGSDYITIDGFTLQENSGNTVGGAIGVQMQTEMGVGIFPSSTTNGAQNNTIQNCTITLGTGGTYQNAIGIFASSSSAQDNAAQVAASTAGTNSNNKIYNNVISGVAFGIYIICPPITASVFETGWDIGGIVAGTGNNITFGNATPSDIGYTNSNGFLSAGIYFVNGAGNPTRFNTIVSSSLSYAQILGIGGIIYILSAPTGVTYSSTISNNNITLSNTGTTAITGVDFGYGIGTGTIVSSSNTITLNQTSSAANFAGAIGIKANYTSATKTASSNIVTINQASSSNTLAGSATGITLAGTTSPTITANSNNITLNVTGSDTGIISGSQTGLNISGTSSTNTANTNTILFNQTTSVATGITSGTIIGIAANAAASSSLNIGSNQITVKQAVTGAGSYGTNGVAYLSIDAAHGGASISSNTFNTTGSTIRSTGNCDAILAGSSTINGLQLITANTANIDRIATSGAVGFITQPSTSPTDPIYSIQGNNITFTNLSGTSSGTIINKMGGNSNGTRDLQGNIISVSGTNTGAVTGITIGAGGSSANATFFFNSITINTASTSLVGIAPSNNTANCNINNNTLSLTSSSTTPTAMTGISVANSSAHSINNNTFSAMNFTGIITTSPTVSGIAVSAGSDALVFSNTITNISVGAATSTGSPLINGINISGGSNLNVYKNKIHGITTQASGSSTLISGIRITGGFSKFIYNNLIGNLTASAATNPDAIRGINITATQASSTQNIYYNTIYLSGGGGTNFGSSGIFHNSNVSATSSALNLRNNIIVNNCTPNGTGLAVAFRRSTTTLTNYASTSNNNDFYAGSTTSSPYFIFHDGTAGLQMAAYKALVTTRDAGSFSEDPEFQSTTGSSADFLKYKVSSVKLIESGAVNIATFTDDYISTTRQGNGGYAGTGIAPDIGAWELSGIFLDLTGPSISYTALANIGCTEDRTLSSVTITDPSGLNVLSGTRPRLYYKKSTNANTFVDNTNATDGWKYVEATGAGGSPFSFTTNYSLLFGGGLVTSDVVQYFVVAQDNFGTPNVGLNSGIFAATPTSVTLTSAAFPITGSINSFTVITGLAGTVNVGPGETYTTLTASGGLFSAINTSGISGNLLANITGNITTEDGTNVLNANVCIASHTITIKPTGTFSVSGSSTDALIKLNGADFVTIDGSIGSTTNTVCPIVASTRDLTISNTNTGTSSAVVWFQTATADGATNNTLMNCNISGNSNTTTLFAAGSGSSTISLTSMGTGNNNNSFINNNISKTQYGIYSKGASTGNKNTGTKINQNLINTVSPNNVGIGGILVGFEDNININRNSISEINGTSDRFGISVGLGNSFVNTTTVAQEVTNATLKQNIIGNIIGTGTTTSIGIGLNAATSGTSLIANNMVSGVISNSISTDFAAGIVLGGGAGSSTQVYYNTVVMQGTMGAGTAGTQTSACLAVTASPAPTIDIRNNIFVNKQIGNISATTRFVCIALRYFSTLGNYVGLTSNHNNFYSAGAGPGTYHIGLAGGVGSAGISKTTLANWTTETGRDGAGSAPNAAQTTLQINPIFTSATDLHIVGASPTNTPLNDAAITVSVTEDFDCEVRATDIGADEFVMPPCVTAVGGTALGNATVCDTYSGNITASGYSEATGSSYQWVSAPSLPGPWTAIGGATNPTSYTISPVITTTTYYKLAVACSTNSSVDSSSVVTITVNPNLQVSVSISSSDMDNIICAGDLVTFTANPVNGGGAPSYQWKHNGMNVGMNSPMFSTSSLANGDSVRVVLTSNAVCATGSPASSNSINTMVNPTVNPGTISGPTSICIDESNFTTNGDPGGTWSSSNNMVATVDNTGLVTAYIYSNFSLTYTISTGCGSPAASPPYPVTVVVSSCICTPPYYTFIGPGTDTGVPANWLYECMPSTMDAAAIITVKAGQTIKGSGLAGKIINQGTVSPGY